MSAEEYNMQLLNRQIEISEWTYNDRMETLFVFQILFIALMIVAIILYLRGAGMLGKAFVGYSIALLLLVVIIIITNRAMYTNRIRDKRAWNRRDFEEDNRLPAAMKPTDPEFTSYINAVNAKYGTTTAATCPRGCTKTS